MSSRHLRTAAVAVTTVLIGVLGVLKVTGIFPSDHPVAVKIVSCKNDRVDIKVVNPTGYTVKVLVWVSTSGNQFDSTAEGNAAPHAQGTGFGRFAGPASGGCTITQIEASAVGPDGNLSPVSSTTG